MEPTLAELAASFEERTLSQAAWTHRAHLRMALWYVDKLGEAQALEALRERIRALNGVHGVPNTPMRGYHETITTFWVRQVGRYRARRFWEPAEVLEAGMLAALGDSRLPLGCYSRERLMSREARERWVEPDLRGLDELG